MVNRTSPVHRHTQLLVPGRLSEAENRLLSVYTWSVPAIGRGLQFVRVRLLWAV